jgi:hypothetical protein
MILLEIAKYIGLGIAGILMLLIVFYIVGALTITVISLVSSKYYSIKDLKDNITDPEQCILIGMFAVMFVAGIAIIGFIISTVLKN